MARVLVLRDAPAARETARELKARGHVPLFLPVQDIVATDEAPPAGDFAGLVVTSRNAVPAISRRFADRALPVLAVGEGTASAMRAAGFCEVGTGENSAESLVAPGRALAARRGLPLLLALGRRRTPVLEDGLRAAGTPFVVWEAYDARALRPDRAAVAAALGGEAPDAVLVLSGGQGEALGEIMAAASDLFRPPPRILCLSARIAAHLPTELQTSALISRSREWTALFDRIAETSFDSNSRPDPSSAGSKERRDMPK